MVKSQEKKPQNYFRCMVKCRRNVNFEEIDSGPSKEKNYGLILITVRNI